MRARIAVLWINRAGTGELRFCPLSSPTAEDVTDVARSSYARLVRVCERHGRDLTELDDGPDELGQDQPALASCYGVSVSDRQLLGDAPGERTRKLVHPVREVASPDEALADVGGVNVHAGPAIDGGDRRRLERLCRYIARPPLAQERLELAPDGHRLIYRFKRPWRNGTHAVVLAPLDLITRLVALIPRPRFHMVRYHGELAAHAKHRHEVVPGRARGPAEPTQLRLLSEVDADALELETSKPPSRHPWAWLLQRVFAVDVMTCPKCEGRMALKKIADTAEDIAEELAQVGLGPRPPPRLHPPLPGQLEFDFAA